MIQKLSLDIGQREKMGSNARKYYEINFDVKKIWFDTDVKIKVPELAAGWKKIDSLDIDPLVVSVGIGKKF